MVDREHGVGLTESDWTLLDLAGSGRFRAGARRIDSDLARARSADQTWPDVFGAVGWVEVGASVEIAVYPRCKIKEANQSEDIRSPADSLRIAHSSLIV